MSLAYQSFRLTLANNNDHAEAYNNLGVLELRKGHIDLVSIYNIKVLITAIVHSRIFCCLHDFKKNDPANRHTQYQSLWTI